MDISQVNENEILYPLAPPPPRVFAFGIDPSTRVHLHLMERIAGSSLPNFTPLFMLACFSSLESAILYEIYLS